MEAPHTKDWLEKVAMILLFPMAILDRIFPWEFMDRVILGNKGRCVPEAPPKQTTGIDLAAGPDATTTVTCERKDGKLQIVGYKVVWSSDVQQTNPSFVFFDDVVNDNDDAAFWEQRRELIKELAAEMDKDQNIIVAHSPHTPHNAMEEASKLAKQYEEHAAKRIFP